MALNHDFMHHSIKEVRNVADALNSLGEVRRHEKDMVIHYESPEQLSLSNMRWEKALKEANESLERRVAERTRELSKLNQALTEAHAVTGNDLGFFQARQPRGHGSAGDAQLPGKHGHAFARVDLQGGNQLAVDLIERRRAWGRQGVLRHG